MKKRKVFWCIFLFVLMIVSIFGIFLFSEYQILEIEQVRFLKYDALEEKIKIQIIKKKSFFHSDFVCKAYDKNQEIAHSNGIENECILVLPIKKDYKLKIEDGKIASKEVNILDYLENSLHFSFEKDPVYLLLGEEKEIGYINKTVTSKEESYTFHSQDENVVKIEGNKMIGVSVGSTEVSMEGSEYTFHVIVTDLIKKASLPEKKKQIVPCNRYSLEENTLLDALLKDRVEDAGYQTRAGAVAAARFLTLEFPYRIPYFYENGRVHPSGINYTDGEGRYYHRGLYLNQSKFQEIEKSYSGPAIWGCPLSNWEDDPKWGFYFGAKVPNGLDCSGFLAWTLYNGGFDPGDVGAGETDYPYQMTDLGDFTPLTKELIQSNKIKVGDLFNYWGHISIIIGMDEDHYYVAESLQTFGGVVARTYTKENVTNTFNYVVLMDSFYKKDGNYTESWN